MPILPRNTDAIINDLSPTWAQLQRRTKGTLSSQPGNGKIGTVFFALAASFRSYVLSKATRYG
jgi:hypothetical protein